MVRRRYYMLGNPVSLLITASVIYDDDVLGHVAYGSREAMRRR